MDNVVQLPVAPEWATALDARRLDWLIAKGYLQQHQRRDWYAVETALRNAAPLKGFLAKYFELGHEIERVHRRINSDAERDRRDYLETWIADYERQRTWLLGTIIPINDDHGSKGSLSTIAIADSEQPNESIGPNH